MTVPGMYRLAGSCVGVAILIGMPALGEPMTARQMVTLTEPVEIYPSTIDIEYEEAKLASPGSTVSFELSYTNEGTEPASDIVLLMPVPKGVDVLAETDSPPGVNVSYALENGMTYTPGAPFENETAGTGPILLANVTNVRWTLSEPVAPSASGTLRFRGVLH